MKKTLKSNMIIIGIILIADIQFFIITTKMTTPTVMEIKMPGDGKDTSSYNNVSSKLNLVLLKNDMIYGYHGNNISDGKTFAYAELRNELKEGIKKYSLDSFGDYLPRF